ncbi:MAG: alpha-xylosidase [Muribaculaceae bacterium]|nr:alpha-xylosidase [Muribaculaceae bacterium]
MKKLIITAALAALIAAPQALAETRTVGGAAYLLSMPKDMSEDFLDMSNTYFFADSLVDFDSATGSGTIKWRRHQLMPRQAFNANTYLHQPLQSLDFPNTAYPQDPELGMSVTPINERTLRVRVHTSAVLPDDSADEVMLVAEPQAQPGSWKAVRMADGGVQYASPYGILEIKASPWRIVLKDASGRELTHTRVWGDNDSTQIKVPPFSFIKRGSDNTRSINPVFSLAPGEKIFGLGESPTALNKAGQKLNLFVTDPQGPEGRDMYKPIPFWFSNRGYGMFMHTAAPVTMDMGNSYIGANKIFMADEDMDFFIFFGEPKDILSEYTALTGRPGMPPLWSFGTWMSRISYFTEDEARDVAAQLKKNRIPADVIHLDTGWFDVDWQCDYEFSPERFADAAKMVKDLRKQGYHISLWQLPYFVPGNKYFPELVEKGLAVKNGRGTLPYEDAVLDFTNPATVDWYQDKIKKLIGMGVGAIKVDFGEAAPIEGVYHNGRTGWYEHNLYPLRYNKAVADATRDVSGENIIWARSAWAGSQRYPLHWGGDAATTNTGMQGTVRAGLSLGLSGFPFWSHDMGGFVTSTPESLYRRWLPVGFLTSHTRAHGAPPTEPWLYDNKEFTDYFRRCAEMKYSLMPYIYTQATESAANGWPMFRAMLLEYPEDPGVWNIDDQYMFGSDMLVAPLFEEGFERDVYLPGDKPWHDYQTGSVYQPGWQHINADGPLQCIILVRDGASIPHVKPALHAEDLDFDHIEWRHYGTPAGPSARGVVIPQK